jgi:hypothetical protein
MNIFVTLYTALLFVLLTPNVLVRLPPTGSKLMVAAVHGLIFALVFHFTHKMVWRMTSRIHTGFEGMTGSVKEALAACSDADKHAGKCK